MKKIAVAVSAALIAGSALAADVTVFGVVDTGLVYNNTDIEGRAQTDTFSMDFGVAYGSRFGFKGTEDLGNGYSVSFHLENGFSSDDGRLGQGNRLFGREARLSLNTPFGTVSAGRMGTLTSGMGTYDIFQLNGDTFDGGFTSDTIGANVWFARDRYDNMLTFVTPKFAGFTGYAQYSNGTDGADDAQTARENNRYAALGVTYENGPLTAVVAADTIIREHVTQGYIDDAQAISFGFNYDLEVAKVFFGAQYGKHEDNFAGGISDKVDGLVAKYSDKRPQWLQPARRCLLPARLRHAQCWRKLTAMLKVTFILPLLRSKLTVGSGCYSHLSAQQAHRPLYTGVGFRKVTV